MWNTSPPHYNLNKAHKINKTKFSLWDKNPHKKQIQILVVNTTFYKYTRLEKAIGLNQKALKITFNKQVLNKY